MLHYNAAAAAASDYRVFYIEGGSERRADRGGRIRILHAATRNRSWQHSFRRSTTTTSEATAAAAQIATITTSAATTFTTAAAIAGAT